MVAFALEQARSPQNRKIHAFGSAAREDDFTRFASKDDAGSFSGIIQNSARLSPYVVNTRRIAPYRPQVRQHGLAYIRIQRRSGVVIEINCLHTHPGIYLTLLTGWSGGAGLGITRLREQSTSKSVFSRIVCPIKTS